MHRVVILGGGFGGLYAAKALGHVPVDVTLVDRRNFHVFQPLLYQVATGSLSPGEMTAPLRAVLRDFVEHYHAERNHQGLGNVIPFPSRDSASPVGRIGRRERLGGVLSFYERSAA